MKEGRKGRNAARHFHYATSSFPQLSLPPLLLCLFICLLVSYRTNERTMGGVGGGGGGMNGWGWRRCRKKRKGRNVVGEKKKSDRFLTATKERRNSSVGALKWEDTDATVQMPRSYAMQCLTLDPYHTPSHTRAPLHSIASACTLTVHTE